jgi:hypothetical protein
MRDSDLRILTFVSQIISSVAWPITILACVILLKRHLVALIPLLRSVKYSDVELRFGQEVAELAKAADNSSLPKETPQDKTNPWEDLIRLANIRPRSAIRAAWERVEDAILQSARARKIEIADAAESMPMVVGAILLNQGAISNAQYDLLSRLRLLANEVERTPPDGITSESAAEFIALALRLAASVNAEGQ